MKDGIEKESETLGEELKRENGGSLDDLLPNYYNMRVHKRKKNRE